MIKISACLVVYNEEQNIERCLSSLVNVVDEIILVHDGVCQDKTLILAEKYQAKIFIRPQVGMMEMHLVFALKQTTGDWILRIDGDEFLTSELQQNLRRLAIEVNNSIGAFSFFWTKFLKQDNRFLKNKERKIIFFRKTQLYWFTMPHLAWQTREEIKEIDYVLGHVVKQTNNRKWLLGQKRWARLQAEYLLKDFSELETFQADRSDWQKFYSWSRSQALNPIWPLIKFIKSLFEELFKGVNLRLALQRALYNFLLGYYLLRLAPRAKRSRP